MKVLVLLCVVSVAVAVSSVQKTCVGGSETGPCRAYMPSYYYDEETGTCQKFIYGGCQGNGNRYATKEECLQNCRTSAVCTLKKEPGLCLAYIPRFYYNAETGRCEKFIYGGCQGNGNNFETLEECEGTCNAHAVQKTCVGEPETGLCRGYFPSYYYDEKTGTCKEFIYGGCGGNGNRYATEDECLQNCASEFPIDIRSASDVCLLEKKSGPCLAYMPRYYFNTETGRCERFIYGGCQGNENNFKTLEECKGTCDAYAPQAALDRPDCDKKPDPGLCDAYFPRFYYDQEAGMCKTFIYGGCGGNRNNFKTEDECYNKCGALAPTASVCEQEKVVGPCRAAFRRYFYNKQTGQCEFFIYGGCRGNENNFQTREECEATCAA